MNLQACVQNLFMVGSYVQETLVSKRHHRRSAQSNGFGTKTSIEEVAGATLARVALCIGGMEQHTGISLGWPLVPCEF